MTATPPRSVLVTPGDVMLFADEAFRNMDVELGLGDIEDIRVAMQSTFDRLAAASVPAGFVLVPVKLSQRMREAATNVDVDTIVAGPTRLNWEEADSVWSAMLAAAPIPTPSQADGAGEVERDGDIYLVEAARDLLNLFDKDQRTVGYRVDRWECLRANLERLS